MELLPNFSLLRPHSITEAVAARAGAGETRFMAGGTDLLPAMRRGLTQADTVIDLSDVAELRGIAADDHGVRIGAGTSIEQLAAHPLLARNYPAVAQAALAIAGPTHRAVGTLGGNLCLDTRCRYYNQSEPWRTANNFCMKLSGDVCRVAPKSDRCYAAYSGDMAPTLMVHGAVAEIAGPGGRRQAPLAEIFADDGIAYLTLAPGELLVAVNLPAAGGWRSGYEKIRTRGAIDFPLVGVAVALRCTDGRLHDLRIATTGTDSQPLMITGLDEFLGLPLDDALPRIDKLLRKQVGPMETTITPATYRRRVVPVLVRRLIHRLMAD
ncbi:MAG: 4-hydroxybenzoyl-CoA reductase subunit beta [Polaromonas sp.]|nr:4-hydroxybenzoyl-CoA reductase subunit beta [Polaromonas sp.]